MHKPFDLFTPTHNANMFTWHENEGVADLSDFVSDFNSVSIVKQCWNESYDYGMTLYSRRTGVFVEFVETGVTKDPDDNTILCWRFMSLCERFKLVIYND